MNHIQIVWIIFLISACILCALVVCQMVFAILDHNRGTILRRKLTKGLRGKRR